jgi:hypothetical protein
LEKIIIKKQDSLRKRYKLRKTGRNWLSWETTIPREVVEREAQKMGIPLSEFQNQFEAEWLFDNFDGIHLIFVPKKGVPPEISKNLEVKTVVS